MREQPLLEFEGLSKRYGAVSAVERVSAAISQGELVSFVGPSGCGKTTLLRLLGGFIRPDAGRILLEGADITAQPPERRATAMVFQSYALFPHMSVADNIGYALTIRKRPRTEIAERVGALLQIVHLDGLGPRRPDQLSGGQQQRVALARGLSLHPKVLLLDEPLSNLDANLRILMRAEIKRLQRELRLTVVYVTHDQEEAMSISDRIAVMEGGRIQQIGTPAEIYERPATEFIARFVGVVNFLEGDVTGTGEEGAATLCTSVGTLSLRGLASPVKVGNRVRLVIRPEAIRIAPPGESGGPNRFLGKVETAMYSGSLIRYEVDAGDLRFTADLYDPRHAQPYREGDQVTLILPDDPHLLPGTNPT